MWSPPPLWYQSYFDKDYLESHSQYFTQEREVKDTDQIISILKLDPGSKILDLCCGQGRHSIELARRGYQVTGVDLSRFLLGLAEKRAQKEGVNVRFLRCDMREIPFQAEFDAVINIFTSFGLLENETEDQKAVKAVSRALRQGGSFLIDLVNRDWLLANYTAKSWQYEKNGVLRLVERRFDPPTSRNLVHIQRISSRGKTKEKFESVRLYSVHELALMLRSEGLETKSTYGSFDGQEFKIHSARIVAVARKL